MLTREQEEAVDRLFVENYGEKVPYYWHRLFIGFTGTFDVNYIPDLLFLPEFERYENQWAPYNRALSDKNLMPLLVANAGVRTPKIVLSCAKGMIRDGSFRQIKSDKAIKLLEDAGEVFVKPTVNSNSGDGCFLARFENGVDVFSGKTLAELLERLGTDFVMQERVICHSSIRNIYAGSVNTFRMTSYRWKDDILFTPSIMRLGRSGSIVDNAGAGGIFIAVDDDGTLHRQAFNESGEAFDRHPDTGLVFEGYRIPLFPEVQLAARRIHEMLPQLGVIAWDFTIDEDGKPLFIEMNLMHPSVELQQMAHGKGLFGENTAEVLRWLRLMKKLKPSAREKYAFGNGV